MGFNFNVQAIRPDRATMSLDNDYVSPRDNFIISFRSRESATIRPWLIPKKLINLDNVFISKYGYDNEPSYSCSLSFIDGLGIIQLESGDYYSDMFLGQEVKIVKNVTTIKGRTRQALTAHKIDENFNLDDYQYIYNPVELVSCLDSNVYDSLKSLNNPLINEALDLPELRYVQSLSNHKLLSDTPFSCIGGSVSLDVRGDTRVSVSGFYVVALKDDTFEVFFSRDEFMHFLTGEDNTEHQWVNITGDEKRYHDIKWVLSSRTNELQNWYMNIFDDNLKTYNELSKITGQNIIVNTIDNKYIDNVLCDVKPEDRTTEHLRDVFADYYELKREGKYSLVGCLNPDIYKPGDFVVTQIAGIDVFMTASETNKKYQVTQWLPVEGFKSGKIINDIPF